MDIFVCPIQKKEYCNNREYAQFVLLPTNIDTHLSRTHLIRGRIKSIGAYAAFGLPITLCFNNKSIQRSEFQLATVCCASALADRCNLRVVHAELL